MAAGILPKRPGWARWYREAREDLAFRYGLRRIPVDAYKEQHALGATPQQAARAIAQDRIARGL